MVLTNVASRGALVPTVHYLLYLAFVLPLLCDAVWYPTTAKFTAMLERDTPNL